MSRFWFKNLLFFSSFVLSLSSYSSKKDSLSSSVRDNQTKHSSEAPPQRKIFDFQDVSAPWLDRHPYIKTEVEKIIKAQKQEIQQSAKATFKEFPHSVLLPFKLHIKELKRFRPDNSNLVSVRLKIYTYTGGAHGGNQYYSWNWNRKEKRFLSLRQYVNPTQFKALAEQTRMILFEMQGQGDQYDKSRKSHIHRGTSTIEDFKIWNFHQNGIMFVFPAYQTGSYAAGDFETFISLSALNNSQGS